MSALLWPTCPKCSKHVDIRRTPDGRLLASCCAGEAEVALGYVQVEGGSSSLRLTPQKGKGRGGSRRAA